MKRLTATLFLFLITFSAVPVLAQEDTFQAPSVTNGTIDSGQGFVPCSGTTCSPCDLVVLFNTLLKWFMGIAFLIFAVLAMKAGVTMVVSGTPGSLEAAKKSFTNAFIGLIIILSAWLIVDTLMRSLIGGNGDVKGYGPWSAVKCATQAGVDEQAGFFSIEEYPEGQDETSGVANSGGTSVSPVPPSGMVSLRSSGVPVASWQGTNGPGRTDLVHPKVAQATAAMLNQWKSAHNGQSPFVVTAAYTNHVGHSAGSQHYNGLAVDLQPASGGANYDQIMQLCRQAGFTFINDERSAHHIHCDMR